ncbi:MAG: PIG-L family deacetylase [Tenacibaculum sp.]|nr:PIG-L family deacetylase [Tenacibaculum sp.]
MSVEPLLIEIRNNEMVLPEEIDANYTIFCKVKIKSTLWGYLSAPSVKINGKQSSKQYFEARANGYRYINISNLYDKEGEVKFQTKNCKIYNETVEVYAYKNEVITNSKILIIAPHPDDAEISAYGLYSKNAENTFILTITGGEHGRDNYSVFNDKEKNDFARMKLRIWNSLSVAMLGNISTENMLNLGYTDASLKSMYEEQEKTFPIEEEKLKLLKSMNSFYSNSLSQTEKSWKTFVSDIQEVINKVQPNIIITPHPYLDKHKDHLYSTLAVTEALQKMNYDKGNLFLYCIHNAVNRYYPFGNIGSRITLPPFFNNFSCFNKLYSFELNEDDQSNKILAFEAMNDLRIGTNILSVNKVFKRILDMTKRRIFDIRRDYYSQFVRSNELFYIIPFNKAEELIKETLQKLNNKK